MIRTVQIFILILFTSSVYAQSPLAWSFRTKGRVYSSPAADDRYLYVGSNDSCLYVLNKENGELAYTFKTGGEIKSKPLLYNDFVIFNSSDGVIYCIDKTSAAVEWTFKTKGESTYGMWDYYLSSPVYANGMIYVGSGDGNVYALRPTTGELIWKFKTGGIVHATPLVHENKVLVGGFDGYFYALNAQSGALIWKFRTVGAAYYPAGEIQKGAAVYKNSVIFGSRDFNVYSLNIETGRGMWNRKERGSWVVAEPKILNDMVYLGTSDSHNFYGLDANSGLVKYTYPLNMRVYGEAVADENNVYFGCFNGKLYRINLGNNELKEVFQTFASRKNYFTVFDGSDHFKPGFVLYGKDINETETKILDLGAILSTPLIDNGIIYFGDAQGTIYACNIDQL